MHLVPLQVSYLEESDPRAALILFSVVGIGIVILIILNIRKNGIGGGSGSAPRRFSRWAFKRTAASYGLDSIQTNFLESVLRKSNVVDPDATLANAGLLDRYFKRSYRDIDATADTEAVAEENKAILFSIREAIESTQGVSAKVSSTRRLPDGMAANLTSPKGESHPVRIISAKGEQIVIDTPRSAIGTPLRFSKGTKLTLSFYAKSSQGYRFETRVVGQTETARGPALELAHSDKVVSLPNRRHRRKETRLSCFFSLVRIEERRVGKKIEKKSMVDERRSMGTIMDISAGGCSIKSAAAMPTGAYLKIEFDDIQGRTLAALGRIVRTNKAGSIGGIMHIQFAKVPRRTRNAICAIVFSYDQD
ncbi:hypothetical protein MASR2M78_04250 [Treponema sp.]